MKWSIKPPNRAGWYLVTLQDKTVMPMYRQEYPAGNFTWQGLAYNSSVIASVRFPKPYQGGT